MSKKPEVYKYDYTNHTINQYLEEDDVLWIVQGQYGRRPILAGTKAEALSRYLTEYGGELSPKEKELVSAH